jgi:hypothetical protein
MQIELKTCERKFKHIKWCNEINLQARCYVVILQHMQHIKFLAIYLFIYFVGNTLSCMHYIMVHFKQI